MPGMGHHLKTPMGKVRQSSRPRSGNPLAMSNSGVPNSTSGSLAASGLMMSGGISSVASTSSVSAAIGGLTPGVLDALTQVNILP